MNPADSLDDEFKNEQQQRRKEVLDKLVELKLELEEYKVAIIKYLEDNKIIN
jgi:hypothetical protein